MHIFFDGRILPAAAGVIAAANKGYRYGDGIFETIKMINRKIPLFDLHSQRLFHGLETLEFSTSRLFTPEKLAQDIISIANKNKCAELGRIRVSVSRGEGGIYDLENDRCHCLIEAWPASPATSQLNENGLVIGIYPHAKKSMDLFSSLKSANYLPYAMAARFARQQQWNDCLILNTEGNIADSTIANVFLVKNDMILTPAEGQGGISGVMRRWLLETLRREGYSVCERTVSVEEALDADEIFLTNAMNGMRWVGQLKNKSFNNQVSRMIYSNFIQPLWS